MLWESSKMEQRYDAVLCVIRDGFTVSDVAPKFELSRQSVHTWISPLHSGRHRFRARWQRQLARYNEDGLNDKPPDVRNASKPDCFSKQ
jgi:transposase-like protein